MYVQTFNKYYNILDITLYNFYLKPHGKTCILNSFTANILTFYLSLKLDKYAYMHVWWKYNLSIVLICLPKGYLRIAFTYSKCVRPGITMGI